MMSTITLHNESENQLILIESFLEKLNIRFEISKKDDIENLTVWQENLIKKGIEQADNNEFYSEEEANHIISECLK
jgi:hypothetical protein